MANRRMFSADVVCTDRFVEMPSSTQALYFQLGMKADDDGFISSPKQITRMVGAAEDDLKLLAAKGFIIPFESGVVVISDWKINNLIPILLEHEITALSGKMRQHQNRSGSRRGGEKDCIV